MAFATPPIPINKFGPTDAKTFPIESFAPLVNPSRDTHVEGYERTVDHSRQAYVRPLLNAFGWLCVALEILTRASRVPA